MVGILIKLLRFLSLKTILTIVLTTLTKFIFKWIGPKYVGLFTTTLICSIVSVPIYFIWLVTVSSASALGFTIATAGITPSLTYNEAIMMNHQNKLLMDVLSGLSLTQNQSTGKWTAIIAGIVGFIIVAAVIYQVVYVNTYDYPSFSEILFGKSTDGKDVDWWSTNNPDITEALQKQQTLDKERLLKLNEDLLASGDSEENVNKIMVVTKTLADVEQRYNPFRIRMNPIVKDVLGDPTNDLKLHLNSLQTPGVIEKIINIPDVVSEAIIKNVDNASKAFVKSVMQGTTYGAAAVVLLIGGPSIIKHTLQLGFETFSTGTIAPALLRHITKTLFQFKFGGSASADSRLDGIDTTNHEHIIENNQDEAEIKLINELLEIESQFTVEELTTGSWTELVKKCIEIANKK